MTGLNPYAPMDGLTAQITASLNTSTTAVFRYSQVSQVSKGTTPQNRLYDEECGEMKAHLHREVALGIPTHIGAHLLSQPSTTEEESFLTLSYISFLLVRSHVRIGD